MPTQPAEAPSLAALFRTLARERGAREALESDADGALTFAELDARGSKVANGLIAEGVKPGDRIAYLGKNHLAFYELLVGAAKARAALMSVNWRLSQEEMEYVLDDAKADVVFVAKDYVATMRAMAPKLTRAGRVIGLHGADGDWPAFAAWRDAQSDADPNLANEPDDDVVQLYTSGTTGQPKGVQLTNANYVDFFKQAWGDGTRAWGRWDETDVSVALLPLYHVAGVNVSLLGLGYGAKTFVHEDVDLARLLRAIQEDKISRLFLVPALVLFLVLTPETAQTDLSSLKTIIYGASPMPRDVLEQARAMFPAHCGFVQVYGLTETNGAATALAPEDHDPARGKLDSCGLANVGVELRVVDEEGKPCPPGETGEILIRAQGVMKGYWGKPDATREAIDADGWFRSGDAGALDEEGYLYIRDRMKDMIISGGENIYPAEVENALFSHPAVADAAVVGAPDDKWGEKVVGFVVLKGDAQADAQAIIDHAREKIAHYKAPSQIEFVKDLPRNPTGKVLRRALREPLWEGREKKV